jgi:hypothetical protein
MSDQTALVKSTRAGIFARPDFKGARRDANTDGLVFACSCGCGGHVLVDRSAMERLEVLRAAHTATAKAKGYATAVFGNACYVKGHEPLGIIGESVRTGERTHLRATS